MLILLPCKLHLFSLHLQGIDSQAHCAVFFHCAVLCGSSEPNVLSDKGDLNDLSDLNDLGELSDLSDLGDVSDLYLR